MQAENWQRIEELFHAAVALNPADRADYLSQQCSGDDQLLQDVECLLVASENVPTFIAKPDLTLGFRVLSQNKTPVRLGQSIAHFRIIEELGKGGMGEVYLAEDQELERKVALKFFDTSLAGNDWAEEQLIGEARAVARLEHTNICAVHDFKKVDDYRFIVMQYLKGETLDELLKRNSLDLSLIIKLAEQMASALFAAHEHGIIHRDIKPRNLMVTPEGELKVLDFGIAKLVKQPSQAEQTKQTSDHTSALGQVAGTAAYMSPEQSKGQPLDFRTDIFSFGIVLYEMLTGKNPFLRPTREETIEAIKSFDPPPPARKGKPVAREIKQIVATCLAKDPDQRFKTTGDLVKALRAERAQFQLQEPAALQARAQRRRKRARVFALVGLPLLILLLAGANYSWLKYTRTHSLAVLKIANNSGDKRLDYLSEGLTRNLLAKFSYFQRIKTKAPTAADSGSGKQPNVLNLGRELHVEAVLYGELVKEDGAPMLRLRLLDTAEGKPKWEQTYNPDTQGLFGLQNDVARQVASSMGLWLTGSERELLEKRQTVSQEALEAYMRGRHYLDVKRTRESLATALKYFDQAIGIDPAFARAYAARADCYILMTNVAFGPIPTKEAMDKARFDAKQAVDTDSSFAEAHNSVGRVRMWVDWNWQEAEAKFLQAIAIDPEYPQAHYDYSRLLSLLGRHDEAIKQSQIAVELDPYARSSRTNYARSFYYARRLNEAEDYFRQLLNDYPEFPNVLHTTGLVLASRGKYEEAIDMLERAHKAEPLMVTAALGYVYGRAGRVENALKMLQLLDEFGKKEPVPVYEKGLIYLGMGRKDEALQMLEAAYQTHYPNLINLGIEPMFDDLRDDPRFISLVKRIGLPQ